MQKSRTPNAELKAVRMIAGLKQDEAAALAGVDRATFNRWETGTRDIPEIKFAKFLVSARVTRQDITEYFARQPKALEYDTRGFPIHPRYGYAQWLTAEDPEFDEGLAALEGVDYPRREARREMLRRGYSGEALERAIEAYLLA